LAHPPAEAYPSAINREAGMADESTASLRDGTGISFVYVRDRERALAFYRDTLGLAVRSSDDYGDLLSTRSGLLRITLMPDHEAGPHPVAGWNVDDIHAAARTLEAAGVPLSRWDGMGQDEFGITASEDGGKMGFFADPDGNALMLVQE
jgi:catechol 2,3-dioxygenase-like lactoylglutathione lyase family enzyme